MNNGTDNDDTIEDLEVPPEPDKTAKKELRKAVIAAQRDPEQARAALRRKVRVLYDFQRLRIAVAGRTQRTAAGATIQLHEADIAVFEARKRDLIAAEKAALTDLQDHLKTIPFYMEVLSDKSRYKGLGPTMAAVILSEFDIHKADTVSKMWSFAGLVTTPCRRCRECQAVVEPITKDNDLPEDVDMMYALESAILSGEVTTLPDTETGLFRHKTQTRSRFVDEDGERKKCPHTGQTLTYQHTFASGQTVRREKGKKLPFNAFLKSKLVEVLAGCLLKGNSPWRKTYDDYKHRKESQGWGMSDGHRHRAAMRYMIKMLLIDIHKAWREFEGLPVRAPYHEEKLGHVHGSAVS